MLYARLRDQVGIDQIQECRRRLRLAATAGHNGVERPPEVVLPDLHRVQALVPGNGVWRQDRDADACPM